MAELTDGEVEEEQVDYEELIESFDLEEAKICCGDCGVVVDGDFDLETIKCALRHFYVAAERTPASVFAQLDASGSGFISVADAQKAFALLGGVLLSAEAVEAKFAEYETDCSSGIAADELEICWDLLNESAQVEVEVIEHATALIFDNGDGPSDWISISDAIDLCLEGTIGDSTHVWTEGMDDWAPLGQCRSRFGLGDDDADDDTPETAAAATEFEEEVDIDLLIGEMSLEDVMEVLADMGVVVPGGGDGSQFPLDTLKSALRTSYGQSLSDKTKGKSVEDVFEELDADSSGR